MPGMLDPKFNGGKVETKIDGFFTSVGQAVAIQWGNQRPSKGPRVFRKEQIVVAGWCNGLLNPSAFALARYNPNGSLDQNFGQGGTLAFNFGNGTDDRGYAVAIQRDGRIVMAGHSNVNGYCFALVRFDSEGNLDPSFGNQGTVTTLFGGAAWNLAQGVAVQPDGKIVAAGYIVLQNPLGRSFIGLARYKSDGSLDAGFGNNGLVVTKIGWFARANALVIDPDGRIVVAGSASPGVTQFGLKQFLLVRYNTDGSIDQNFGGGAGWVTTDFGAEPAAANAIAITRLRTRRGKTGSPLRIVAGGWASHALPGFALARYFLDGSLDQGFGNGGKVLTPIRAVAETKALAIQSDGKIVAAGSSAPFPLGASLADSTLAQYQPDGSLDPNFGAGGLVITPWKDPWGNPAGSEANGIAIQTDGKVVAAGFLESVVIDDFAVARYV